MKSRSKIAILAAMVTLFTALWVAHGMPPQITRQVPDAPPMRFAAVDVLLECGEHHLGSYQIELTAPDAKIVGLEGGESPAFQSPPYYDPQALHDGAGGNRIIIAAFSTDNTLPTGTTRITRLHLMVNAPPAGPGAQDFMPGIVSKLTIATDSQGRPIPAKITLRLFAGGRP